MTEQLEGQISIFDLGLPFSKTCPEHSQATRGRISAQSSRRFVQSGGGATILYLCLRAGNGCRPDASWETVGALPGMSTTPSAMSPSAERGFTLSQILQANVPEKYYLSPKACQGILNRAKRRGKALPDIMREALEEAVSYSTPEETGEGISPRP